MKNFPSSLIRQQNTKNGLGNTMSDTLKNIGTKAMSNILGGGDNSKDYKDIANNFNDGYTRPELPTMIDDMNMFEMTDNTKSLENKHNNMINLKYNVENGQDQVGKIVFEDPFEMSSTIFSVINTYRYIYKYTVPAINRTMGYDKGSNQFGMIMSSNAVSPSLFNPWNGINVTGITETIPLINADKPISVEDRETGTVDNDKKDLDALSISISSDIWKDAGKIKDISDCSIQKLVELSQTEDSELGLATYRYADFMYCKDLGKIPNNRLITLRKFPAPIGDNIFNRALPNKSSSKGFLKSFESYPDVGRLITWFDNDDNKLEDICKYNYHATWKELTSKIDVKESQDEDEGILSKVANFLSPQNNNLVGQGFSGRTGALAWGANKLHIPFFDQARAERQYYDLTTLSNYDQNKVYEQPNRIASTHIYDGNLLFNQEITLVFKYTLRSYANINPRAAMLDLLGNVFAVTYKSGTFWSGENWIIGGQGNRSVYDKANALIDKKFDEIGGFFSTLRNGSGIEYLQGWIQNLVNTGQAMLDKAVGAAGDAIGVNGKSAQEETKKKAADVAKDTFDKVAEANKKYGWTNALKGMLKNQLGRPSIYAFNSLLTGEEVGLWHLTIGNPRNPIMSIGNLILENSEVQHSGPLGLDDFPTELKVTITLKHAMPRDSFAIQRMYTKGYGTIYKPMNLIDVKKYYNHKGAFGDIIANSDDKALRMVLSNL